MEQNNHNNGDHQTNSNKKLPKRIILVRHGESEGNLDNTAYSTTPDHKISLTEEGRAQARHVGSHLRDLISNHGSCPDWRVYFYVSSYERTRSTLQEIGKSFPRKRVIGVREECRIQEQDFGNFQVEERMKVIKETREKFRRFFYRFPEGESAADVFDHVSITTTTGQSVTECTSCGRVIEERQSQNHHLFHVRAQDTPICLVTSDIPAPACACQIHEDDPFEPTGFITAFSTWSFEPSPLVLRSSLFFSGHLAELERILELSSSSMPSSTSSSTVVVDNLRAYMQIIDVASILGLDCDISDHAFQLFRDCCSATCLRNRRVEALATVALVQAIREAQEPRTLQEISIAANVPQKEIGKYIKILGEALQLSQPINSNSISVHIPTFCTLLQLNKSAQVPFRV